MRPDLVEILACPVCKGPLTLLANEEQAGEVISGTLQCTACGEAYPIRDGIPNLLPPELPEALAAEHAAADVR